MHIASVTCVTRRTLRDFRCILALEALVLSYLGTRLPDLRYWRVGDAVFAFVALAYLFLRDQVPAGTLLEGE